MAFTLRKKACSIDSFKVSEESVDIKIILGVDNKFLYQLAPGLRTFLFRAEGEGKGETADIDPDHLVVIRYPAMNPLPWKEEMVGAIVMLHGASKADTIELQADVNQLVLELCEGGSVEIAFRVQILPEAEVIGKLGNLVGKNVAVSVAPAPMSPG